MRQLNRLVFASLLSLVGCSNAEQRPRAPLAHPLITMALEITGPDADGDKRERCLATAYSLGVAVDATATTQATLTLASPNHLSVTHLGESTADEDIGGWPMEALCETACAAAVEAAGPKVTTSKSEPGPECRSIGGVQSKFTGSYGAAVRSLKMAALRARMNFVVLDAVAGYTNSTAVQVTGRGYRCPFGGNDDQPGSPVRESSRAAHRI